MVTQGPVTLFGAVATKTGWEEIGPTFDWLASAFSNCESFEYEVVAAGVSDDLCLHHRHRARRRRWAAERPSPTYCA